MAKRTKGSDVSPGKAETESKRQSGTYPARPEDAVVDASPRPSDVAPRSLGSAAAAPFLPEAEPPPSLSELIGPPSTDRAPATPDRALLDSLHEAFSGQAGPDSRIDVGELTKSLKLRDPFLAERILLVFDQNGDGYLTRQEFLDRARRLLLGGTSDKLRFAFRVHDLDADDVIERAELVRMISSSMAEEETLEDPAAAERLTDLLLSEADSNKNGRLSFREFEAVLTLNPRVLELVTRTAAHWIVPDWELSRERALRRPLRHRLKRALQNRWLSLVLLAAWLLVSLALALNAALKYQAAGANGFVMLARACGAALNFNGALILVPVMRRLLTWVRKTPGLSLLPVDDAIGFHRLVGHTLFALALLHTLAHLANYQVSGRGIAAGVLGSPAGLTGASLFVVFSWMWFCSRPQVRGSGRFELFYFSHLLYVAWFALCLAHGPVFYLWAMLPLFGFGIEQLWRIKRRAQVTAIVATEPLPSGVTRLEIARPQGFRHAAGDYAFLRVPELAPHEWHPFTISSAPERARLTMHVRSLGDFTQNLATLARTRASQTASEPLTAYLDGPYGTASGRIFDAKHAILVGAGIGVTPFASVLESIILRSQAGQTELRSVDFYWLNRDPHSFEWFLALLLNLEQLDRRELVKIHIYLTGGQGHLGALALNLAREISHRRGNPDEITGLCSQTHVGRPDWSAEFQAIASAHAPEAVEVFFCGPPGLARQVKQSARALGLRFRQEHF